MGTKLGAKLGIVAGGGDLPLKIAEACRATGRPFYVLGLEGQAPAGQFDGLPHGWIRLGAVGEGVSILRRELVSELVFAGAVLRPSLKELRPDAFATRVLAKSVLRRGDDGLLRALMDMLERELGATFVAPEALLGDLVARQGIYGQHQPDEDAWADIEHGAHVARTLGALDIGQSVVVQGGLVLGLEAVEGTDALLARCIDLAKEGDGGVLVKLAKPQQDRRADLPTVGLQTIDGAISAGLRGIAVEVGGALILDEDAMVERADAQGIFFVGLGPGGTR